MKLLETLFGNLFDRANIATFRLVAFAHYLLAALTSHNDKKDLDNYIQQLTDKLNAVEGEMDQIVLGISIQLSKTGTVDDVVDDFEAFMIDSYVDINYKTKSIPQAAEQFYPHGKNEFHHLDRSNTHAIMKTVSEHAKTYTALLGKDLTDQLTGFITKYDAAREAQLKQMSIVTVDRGDKNTARPVLELMLTEIVHEIARRHPGDVAACKGYMRWNLLYAPGSKRDTGEDEPTPPPVK